MVPDGVEDNHSELIGEPSSNVQKLDHNGVSKASTEDVFLKVKKLSERAVLPWRGSPSSAGYDLSSATDTRVPARGNTLVPTDISISTPEGTYARLAPRWKLVLKHSIVVGDDVIDNGVPVGVCLINHSDVDFEVKAGDRIAQLVIESIMTPEVSKVKDLDDTARGCGGLGSTGV